VATTKKWGGMGRLVDGTDLKEMMYTLKNEHVEPQKAEVWFRCFSFSIEHGKS